LKAILDGMIDKPSAARNLLKRLRGVFSFAADRGLIAFDPTVGVKLPIVRTAGFRAWTDDDIERFRSHWPNGSRARLALELLLFTGQRRSDVVRMGRQHVREGAIHVTQKKTGTHLSIPIHPILGAELDRLPKTNLTFVMTAQGKPMSEAGFTQWFVECAQAAGLPERSGPHGLRKAAGRMLAEAGCSALEIAAITGHASLKEVERYTKSAQQAKLARSAISRVAADNRA
jgi:integrase